MVRNTRSINSSGTSWSKRSPMFETKTLSGLFHFFSGQSRCVSRGMMFPRSEERRVFRSPFDKFVGNILVEEVAHVRDEDLERPFPFLLWPVQVCFQGDDVSCPLEAAWLPGLNTGYP